MIPYESADQLSERVPTKHQHKHLRSRRMKYPHRSGFSKSIMAGMLRIDAVQFNIPVLVNRIDKHEHRLGRIESKLSPEVIGYALLHTSGT